MIISISHSLPSTCTLEHIRFIPKLALQDPRSSQVSSSQVLPNVSLCGQFLALFAVAHGGLWVKLSAVLRVCKCDKEVCKFSMYST